MADTVSLRDRVRPARLAQDLGRRRWVRGLGRRLAPLDQRLSRAGGRISVAELAGLPLLRLRVPRRRGGDTHAVVVGARFGEQWLIAGGDDGRPVDHRPVRPPWVLALRGSRTVHVEQRGVEREMRVHRATRSERERWWPLLVRTWPAYADLDRDAVEQWDVWILTPLS